jgi:hypothetical protein
MKTTPSSLEDRIKALHEALEVVIAKYIDARAATCIGVPRASVEGSLIGRAGGCRCEEFRVIRKLITDAEALAERQKADALSEG